MADAGALMQGLALGFQQYHDEKKKRQYALEDQQRTQKFDLSKLGIQHGYEEEDATKKFERDKQQSIMDFLGKFLPQTQGITLGGAADTLNSGTIPEQFRNNPIVPPSVQNSQFNAPGKDAQHKASFISSIAGHFLSQGYPQEVAIQKATSLADQFFGSDAPDTAPAPSGPPALSTPPSVGINLGMGGSAPAGIQPSSPLRPDPAMGSPDAAPAYQSPVVNGVQTTPKGALDMAKAQAHDATTLKIAEMVDARADRSLSEKRREFVEQMRLNWKKFTYQQKIDAERLAKDYFGIEQANFRAQLFAEAGLTRTGMTTDQSNTNNIRTNANKGGTAKLSPVDDLRMKSYQAELTSIARQLSNPTRKDENGDTVALTATEIQRLKSRRNQILKEAAGLQPQASSVPFGDASSSAAGAGADTSRFGNISSQPYYATVKQIWNNAGIADFAWMHNVNRESGGNPNATGDHGHSHGIYQFNFAGGLGSTLVAKYGMARAMQIARDPVLASQVMVQEAKAAGVDKIRDPVQQAIAFMERVERPAKYVQDQVRRELLGGGRTQITFTNTNKKKPKITQADPVPQINATPKRQSKPTAADFAKVLGVK